MKKLMILIGASALAVSTAAYAQTTPALVARATGWSRRHSWKNRRDQQIV
jgi:hypothetical protein